MPFNCVIDNNYPCNIETPFKIINTGECVKNCPIKNIIDKSCKLQVQEDEYDKVFDILLDNIETDFTSNNYNTSDLEQGNNDIIQFEIMVVTLTTTQNQKNDINNSNTTTIDLGDCENLLKNAYTVIKVILLY